MGCERRTSQRSVIQYPILQTRLSELTEESIPHGKRAGGRGEVEIGDGIKGERLNRKPDCRFAQLSQAPARA